MTEHLTSQQVTAWRSGVSSAEEILRLDDHLAECPECRDLLASRAGDIDLAVRSLRAGFSAPHLTENQLDDYAAQRPLPADVMQHLDRCPECRADAEDLRQFADAAPRQQGEQSSLPVIPIDPVPTRLVQTWVRQIWLRPMAAAIAITALALAAWLTIHHRAVTPENQPPVQIASNIPRQYQSEVQAAIDSGTLHIPASIAGMTTGPIQLRSDSRSEASSFHLISPEATAVIDDTPTFRWTPIEGATYTVSVYDDQFRAIATSPGIRATEWRPEKPFPRSAVYLWEVRAVHGSHVERAPSPTEPEARFAVLSAPDAQRLAEARAAMPNQQLALGILYADSGATEDAKRELTAATTSSDPKQKSAAETLLRQLK